jgi:hypothetical protein
VKDKDQDRLSIPKDKIKEFIPSALEYACINWISHLLELSKKQEESIEKKIVAFFESHVLRWIELI